MRTNGILIGAVAALLLNASVGSAVDKWGLTIGTPELKSASVLAFGPDGILLVADDAAGAVYGIDTGETTGEPAKVKVNIPSVDKQVASALGAKAVTIEDLAINPLSGSIFLAVSADNKPAIARIDASGKISPLSLKEIRHTRGAVGSLSDASKGGTITDLAYVDGKVIVSTAAPNRGAAVVSELAFPFGENSTSTNIEIYHGAHGKYENNSPVRVFVPFNIDGEPSLLAGFTCTPLVKFPLNQIKSGEKVRGTTLAELGNRNRPLDMIVYKQDDKNFLLIANSARGVMKVSTDGIERSEGITERISGTAGQKYDTIKELEGTVQLDKLNDSMAVVIIQPKDGSPELKTIALP